MKKFESFKLFQFTFFILYSVICCACLFNNAVKQFIFASFPATLLFFLIWGLLLCNFVFIIIDFKLLANVKSGSQLLYDVAYSDQLTNIPNRLSCDTIIEKYQEKLLPDYFTCVLFELTNLKDLNAQYGHKGGNLALKEFSTILTSASSDCFVGRNGGNVFLVFFEHGTSEQVTDFISTVSSKVKSFNQKSDSVSIQYKYGSAFNDAEDPHDINQLISLAYNQVHQH